MVQILEKSLFDPVLVEESKDIREIREVLNEVLYVPDIKIRDNIIYELCSYIQSKFADPKYKLKVFVSYQGIDVLGFVIVQLDPNYTSYSRKCGTFGWLYAQDLETCKKLIKQCELFMKENRVRKLRGPINFPKNIGGIGFQARGFEEQMLYGVSSFNKSTEILSFLEELGYKKESEYTCVYVAQKSWDKGRKIDDDIIFRYFSLKELYEHAEEIRNLANNSFFEILPDASGKNRVYEFFEAFSKIPKDFYKNASMVNPHNYTDVPQFAEAWETCDLEKIEPYAPMAFSKSTGELVGVLLGLPDLYESWRGEPITRTNVDTAMVKKGFFGKGIFSALNNLGQLTCNFYGVDYFEGTAIWSNNSRAIDTIFPHSDPIRKHYIVQKRV
ncbi:hypothetical protein LCGC14_1233300 [marine sediment metagenome]|uniref:N-acetyltransferase domain-containing protein n=1 Tax=marine sediment metagenome TaxID=412755 RepID=A0A0F9NQ24_9ZZZZ